MTSFINKLLTKFIQHKHNITQHDLSLNLGLFEKYKNMSS